MWGAAGRPQVCLECALAGHCSSVHDARPLRMKFLDSIEINGFRSIRHVKCDLQPINIVIGANGSGKSNFIGAFSFLREILEGRTRQYVIRHGGADRILYFGSKTTDELSIRLSTNDNKDHFEVKLVSTSGDSLSPVSEWHSHMDKSGKPKETITEFDPRVAAISQAQELRFAQIVQSRIRAWKTYHFHDTGITSPMKKTSDLHDNRSLHADGSNLPAFLYLLSRNHKNSFNFICHAVRQVAPFFDRFNLEPQALNNDKIQLEWRHRAWDTYLDASSLSDGTLRFIALATLLLQPADLRPSVIFLDEPELGLHPYAIGMLAALIKQASVDTQLVIATQSSLLLDDFDPDSVLVADRVRGATEIRRLDPGDLKACLMDYSLGQLWEKNYLGGRPAPEDQGRHELHHHACLSK